MIPYKEYEKTVYEWLMSKHKADSTFTFSTRLNGLKGSELDYFIGTEKSGYFGLTFWSIPVGGFPGSAGDLIDVFFKQREDGFKFYFEFSQTMSASDEQNVSALNLIKNIKEEIRALGEFTYETSAYLKRFKYALGSPKPSYLTLDELFVDLEKTLNAIIPIVENGINEQKELNPNFSAQRITLEQFQEIHQKLNKRFIKYNIDSDNHNDKFNIALSKHNQSDLNTYFDFLRLILKKYDLKPNDERLFFSVTKNNLNFTIGQRYCWNLFASEKKGKFGVISKNVLNQFSEEFSGFGVSAKAFYTHFSEFSPTEEQLTSIFSAIDSELKRTNKSSFLDKKNIDFENYSFEYINANTINKADMPLNQILYGPPGTGKTYNTINESLQIVDPEFYRENENDRKKLTDRFKELLIKSQDDKNGQIGFCTFHQSFSYEDFVEGIKPKTSDTKSVYYDVEPGIFKRICQLADSYNSTVKVKTEGKLSWSVEQFRKASFYKLSLGAFYNPSDKPIYEYCRDNSYIAIGFGQENDFTGLSESQIVEKCDELNLEVTAAQQMNYFIHYLKKGNYVIIGNGNKYVRAIGKVVGDYEYVAESTIQYNHFRKVEWLFVDENIPIEEIYERGLSQKTMYKIDETALKQDFFTNNGQKEFIDEPLIDEKKYVLVIDEINRGNVSSIFGELITLIEKDKRTGCEEELEVILPYSKELFKVPKNVYIIGTMNTADRSIEALDTALRRRFSFTEMPPKPELILQEGKLKSMNGKIDDIDVVEILMVINDRIEKLINKDHKIGHSYFLGVESLNDLKQTFTDKVIPLLEEYFFGDFGKISLVLGSSFISKSNKSGISFAKNNEYDPALANDLIERGVYEITNSDNWDFKAIYQ